MLWKDNIISKPEDKDSSLVVQDKCNYINKAFVELGKEVYDKLSRDPSDNNNFKQKLYCFVPDMAIVHTTMLKNTENESIRKRFPEGDDLRKSAI